MPRTFNIFYLPSTGGPLNQLPVCLHPSPCDVCVLSNTDTVALIPYFIFSLFHALTFTRTTLMPRFLPAPVAPAGSPSQAHPLAKRLQLWVKGMVWFLITANLLIFPCRQL